jgi:SAM-dependent methyltransferase
MPASLTEVSGQRRLAACPLCGSTALAYQFTHQTTAIVRCGDCGLLMRNPQPSEAELAAIYTREYFIGHESGEAGSREADDTDRLKRGTAAGYLDAIEARLRADGQPSSGLRLLEVGSGLGNLLAEAQARGHHVRGIEYAESSVRLANARLGPGTVRQGSIESVELPAAAFDVCVMADLLEHTRDPVAALTAAWRALRPDGVLFLAVPSLDSWSARLMRQRWLEFKLEHLFYFDGQTVQSALFRTGFDRVAVALGRKTLSPQYVMRHFDRFPVPVLSPLSRLGQSLVPGFLRRRPFHVVASGIDVLARRRPEAPLVERSLRLSVVMPVYNERATVGAVIEQVLAKTIPGVAIDVTIVESASTDGTRDEVRRFEGAPRVTVVWQERPRGKGHAVREGLLHATGEVILIQDADLEYDVNDYDSLVDPIRSGRAALVLGVRHGATGMTWKMRHFTDQVLLSRVMNVGHFVFTWLFNIVYGTRLRDPFTMFKVFRRDCLFGLTLEANRFDFDWELLGKLVRAGYAPLEVPVNYTSRSFRAGKKVRFWRDPLTWIRACVKYRFVKLGK